MSKITLDAETFKALASATRLTVLKALDERRKTLSELARDLDLNKATVHEHLGLLLAAGLVRKRDDEGRKWIYYELTWTGQSILRPEATTTFNVLLGLCALSAGGGMFMLGRALDWWLSGSGAGSASSELGDPEQLRTAQDNDAAGSEPAAASASGTSSATGTETGTQTSAPQGGAPADSAMQDTEKAFSVPSADDHHGLPFFDDGGWIAIALIAAFAVFCVLAWFLYLRLRPKPFDAASAEQAESTPDAPV